MKTFKNLSDRRIGYIAGFLDADGCINAQLVRREDYKFKYQIRVSVTFFQKKKRKHVLLHLQKDLLQRKFSYSRDVSKLIDDAPNTHVSCRFTCCHADKIFWQKWLLASFYVWMPKDKEGVVF